MVTTLVYVYFILAIGYNVLSQICFDIIGRAFAPTDPSYGFQVMTIVLILFVIRDSIPNWIFLPLFFLWTLSTVRFGIGNHLPGYKSETYLNKFTWASALLINVYGSTVFLIFTGIEVLALI